MPAEDQLPARALFPEQMARKDRGICPFCNKDIDPAEEFRDRLSLREFEISGLCQKCQDGMFE